MGRSPCCVKEGLNRGAWTAIEDKVLTEYIKVHGEGRWRNLPERAGLKRCGKSCRLRWLNYLRPDIKRGNITPDEEELIIRLHKLLGNRWSLIAGRLPGRTDNEIKNYWNTIISKRAQQTNSNKETNADSPSSSASNNKGVIRTKATKCSRVYLDPHLQPCHTDMVSTGPLNDVVVGELSPPTHYENQEFMFGANQDLEMGFLDSEFSDLFHVNYGEEKVNDVVRELSPPTHYENLEFMFGANQDLDMGFVDSELFHVNYGEEKVNDVVSPRSSSPIQQAPLISDELALMENWNVQSWPVGKWLAE